jgi:opacity protein-like surface antigen
MSNRHVIVFELIIYITYRVIILKKNILAVILLLSFINAPANAWTGNANAFFGQKTLDKDDWEPADKQVELGVLFDFKQSQWPVSIAIDLLTSKDEVTVSGVDTEARTAEFDVGVRKIWDISGSSIRPYIGGGIAFVSAEIKETPTNISVNDTRTGFWLNGGIYWTLTQYFNLGLDLRYSQADVTLYNTDVEAGGTHVGIILGYHW